MSTSPLASRAAAVPQIWKNVGWSILLLFAILMFLLASRYLTMNPVVYFPQQKEIYIANTAGILLHIVGAMVATILGPFQFLPRIRSGRWLNVHRWLGRSYLIGVLVGGLGGLYMARLAYGGWPARLGFAILAILWLFSGWMAYRQIRNKQIQIHRRWMIRNYALTFAAVMLRLWLPFLQATGIDFLAAYVTVAWLCWIPNLLIAELVVRRIRQRQLQATPA